MRHLDNKIDGTCILMAYGWTLAGKPLKVISGFLNFTQNVYISSNIDKNCNDFIQFCSYFVHLIENENIPDSKLIYIYANLMVL